MKSIIIQLFTVALLFCFSFDVYATDDRAFKADNAKEVGALIVAVALGADVNSRDMYSGQTALHYAARYGTPEQIKTLISLGADVTVADRYWRQTPLHIAAIYGTPEHIEAFITSGTDVNIRNDLLRVPLHTAISAKNIKIKNVETLISLGADVNARDWQGRVPLFVGADRLSREEYGSTTQEFLTLVHLFLQNGADINLEDNSGSTLLHFAAEARTPDEIQVLLDAGADVHARTKEGLTPLFRAATRFWNSSHVIYHLVRVGADVHAVDKRGRTPLHWAAMHGTLDNAGMIINYDPDANARDNRGRTPLHEAARVGTFEVVKALIRFDADIYAEDEEGRTPLFYAERRGGEFLESLKDAKNRWEKLKEELGWEEKVGNF